MGASLIINSRKPIEMVVPEFELELEVFEVATGLGRSAEDGDLQEAVQNKTKRNAKPIRKSVFFMR